MLINSSWETLILTGTEATNCNGNWLTNVLIGNMADNVLDGAEGSDTLDGGVGNDTLNGGEGADSLIGANGNDMLIGDIGDDSYQFTCSTGKDTVVDTDHCPGNLDIVQFGANIASSQLWFRHVGNDLEVSIIGTTDSVIIQNWYSGTFNYPYVLTWEIAFPRLG